MHRVCQCIAIEESVARGPFRFVRVNPTDGSTAGTITTLAGDPRVMQFSIRVHFCFRLAGGDTRDGARGCGHVTPAAGQVIEDDGGRTEVATSGFGDRREVATPPARLSPIRLVTSAVGSAERLPIAEPDDVPDAASVAEPPAAPPPEVRRRSWKRRTWAVPIVLLAGGAAGVSVTFSGM